jgi:RimJ/RimL family protein N-acetyltransferase
MGYATEAAKAMIDHVKESGITSLYAVVDQDNPKSSSVCERLGMEKLGLTQEWYGQTLLEYVIMLE